MGTTADLEASATLGIKLRRALTLALIVAIASVVGSQNIPERVFFAAPVAADVGSESTAGQRRGSGTTGGNTTTFSPGDFESSIGGRYGGFDVAVIGSRGIPTNNSGLPIVIVELAVRNSTDRQLRLSKDTFGLQDQSGRILPIHRFEHTEDSSRLIVDGGTIHAATAVVRLPPLHLAEPGDYRLHVAEPYRQPLLLPITEGSFDVDSEGVDTTTSVGIELNKTSSLTVLELSSSYNHRAHRAQTGHHLLSLTVDAIVGPDATAAHVSGAEWWSVTFDDQHRQAAVVAVEAITGNRLRATIVFEIPETASNVALVTGRGESSDHQANITFTRTATQ